METTLITLAMKIQYHYRLEGTLMILGITSHFHHRGSKTGRDVPIRSGGDDISEVHIEAQHSMHSLCSSFDQFLKPVWPISGRSRRFNS